MGRPSQSAHAKVERPKPVEALVLMRVALRTTIVLIKTFQHKGLKAFFETGSMTGIQAIHAPRLAAMLRRLNEIPDATGMGVPGWGLHSLQGRALNGHFSVKVSGNWRVTFTFDGTDAVLVNYQIITKEIYHGTHV